MKSRAGYVFAALCLVVGLAVGGWLVWSEVAKLGNVLTRFVVPGTAEVNLNETGTYTIFHETESVIDGKIYSAANLGGLQVTVTGPDGKLVGLVTPNVNTTYTIGGHSGKSVLAFTIIVPGKYWIAGSYPDGQTGPQTVLATATGFVGTLVWTILGAVGAVFIGFVAALTLFLTTFFRRRRLLRAA
ncbi:MAG TPA: hypothetical protein VM782_09980 [Stellaceae bacterium]|nr:hypothetical protein [Stellaceae bacterium]